MIVVYIAFVAVNVMPKHNPHRTANSSRATVRPPDSSGPSTHGATTKLAVHSRHVAITTFWMSMRLASVLASAAPGGMPTMARPNTAATMPVDMPMKLTMNTVASPITAATAAWNSIWPQRKRNTIG